MGINNYTIVFLVSLIIIFIGCKKEQSVNDHLVHGFRESIIDNPKYPREVQQRAEQVIHLWNNGIVNKYPVLIGAISQFRNPKFPKTITVIYYDENNDLLGVTIEEYSHNKNKIILREHYPIFNHNDYPYVTEYLWFEIIPRLKGDLKDVDIWEEYLSSEQSSSNFLPPIFVSIPNEDIDIYISLYDRKGNKSNRVKLYDVAVLPKNTSGDKID